MKALLALAMLTATTFAANTDTRVFEMRTYFAAPGKLDALNARFRDHTCKLFEKHGITNIGYWMPIENPELKLIYVLAYPDRAARDASWKAFMADPDWQAAYKASEVDGKLVAKVEQIFFTALDFSPEIKPGISTDGRVFEMRTYTTPPGRLENLHARFRDHTVKLFAKHGMTNLFYWKLLPDQPKNANLLGTPDTTLIYLLAHQSPDAAKASFGAFRGDPDWVAARKASEEKAGGSLTVEKDGVKSLFMKATDYSQTK
ncbi:MAG: NIPSNAP family protein [Chthoniobacteraceae bacterium]